jgi:ParB/RepB/Spo0J family partition protein
MATAEMTRTAEFREIRLSRITVAEGFNPRGEVCEDDELRALAETIRARGCLQPIRVRESETGEYVLVAGERRYRAAALAGLAVIPATVLPVGAGDEAERVELLSDAVIENELRRELDPLQRARGYRAMLDGGLTVRGIAERLGGSSGRRGREQRIREHLSILELPVEIMRRVQAGEVPLLAMKALRELAGVHEELAQAAVAAVLEAGDEAPYTWSEVVEEPLAVAVNNVQELPLGLFNTSRSHPVERFALSDKARRDLKAYEKLTGRPIGAVRFTAELLERPRAIGAVHDCGWFAIVAGQEVADSLAEDYIAATLKQERAARRRDREEGKTDQRATSGNGADGERLVGEDAVEPQQQRQERERERRDADREQRERATRFNLELGLLAFKHLPKVKVEARVLRILASVDVGGSLRQLAATGARLTLPSWMEQSTRANGATKTTYIDESEAASKAVEFLSGARSATDVAGRAITLIALAELADQEALAPSRRSWYSLRFAGPWAEQARLDLYEIVRERIKEGQLPALDERLSRRQAQG